MKLLYITTFMPFGHDEAFLIDEAKALIARGQRLVITPRGGPGCIKNRDAEELIPFTVADAHRFAAHAGGGGGRVRPRRWPYCGNSAGCCAAAAR